MSEQEKKTEKAKTNDEMSIEEAKRILEKGKLKLASPIYAGGRQLDTLAYDFGKITGTEYMDALDGDPNTRKGAFSLSARQAVSFFLCAVIHATDGVNESDLPDLRKNLSMEDTLKAIQIAVSFFNASSRAGAARILTW